MNKTKKAIFEAAIKIFSSNGYNGATMDEVASIAGVAKGTLYYHFKSKEEIFKFIISEGMNIIREEINEATSKEEDPFEKLKALCRVQLTLVYRHKDLFKVIMSQIWGQEDRQLELRAVIERYVKSIAELFKEAIDKKVIENSNPHFLAYTFFGSLTSAAVYQLIHKEDENIEVTTEKIMSYIMNGIKTEN